MANTFRKLAFRVEPSPLSERGNVRIITSAAEDIMDLVSLFDANVGTMVSKAYSCYTISGQSYIELLGDEGKEQWRKFMAPYIWQDKSNSFFYFLVMPDFTLYKNENAVKELHGEEMK